ncbi:D-alanyl-D-alanine carboxypeptidase [Parafrigoribacterium mesophilum]|uniref:D-alanyl-D-alanine carboxypeptidase family protein n=1 Tax=Parafrigoribacterium mesophilum TaxID=433646 RepID=UPI0031FD02BF
MRDEFPAGADDLAALLERASADAERWQAHRLDPEVLGAARRRRRRRRIIGGAVAFVIVAGIGAYVPTTLMAPVDAATASVELPEVAQPVAAVLSLPQVGASAISISGAKEFTSTAGTNGILAASGGPGPRPIASISKLITALVVLDAKPLGATENGPSITFSKTDADLYDKYYVLQATEQPMKAGSTLSERDALKLMLVVSASNYAEAVTDWAFGSQAGFRRAVKSWLSVHDLTGTTVVEPTGIDSRNVSTPANLLTLGKMALATPLIAAIVASKNLDVPGFDALPNTNRLLGVDGVTGIKTGTLDAAGACLLFSATVEVGLAKPITVLGVILGGTDHNAVNDAARALLRSIKAGFHRVPLLTQHQKLGTYTTAWGDTAAVVAADGASVLTWSDLPITDTLTTKRVTTARRGSGVGTATFVAGRRTVTVPLVLDGALNGPDAWWRLTHPAELLTK